MGAAAETREELARVVLEVLASDDTDANWVSPRIKGGGDDLECVGLDGRFDLLAVADAILARFDGAGR